MIFMIHFFFTGLAALGPDPQRPAHPVLHRHHLHAAPRRHGRGHTAGRRSPHHRLPVHSGRLQRRRAVRVFVRRRAVVHAARDQLGL